MPQKHYATRNIAQQTNAIALPDHWVQPNFQFGDEVKTNGESYKVIGLAVKNSPSTLGV